MTEGRVLEGQVAIVTGAGQGIGAGIATALAAAGAAVMIAARRADNGEPAAESIRAAGHEAVFVRCDVTETADVEATVDEAVKRFGGLDIMVHNAVAHAGRPGGVQFTRSDMIRPQIAHCHHRKLPVRPGVAAPPAAAAGHADPAHFASRCGGVGQPADLRDGEGDPARHRQEPGPGVGSRRRASQRHRPGGPHTGHGSGSGRQS